MDFHNCHHCNTNGVLLMSDGRCPNCKNILVEASTNIKSSTEQKSQKVSDVSSDHRGITAANSSSKEPSNKAESVLKKEAQESSRIENVQLFVEPPPYVAMNKTGKKASEPDILSGLFVVPAIGCTSLNLLMNPSPSGDGFDVLLWFLMFYSTLFLAPVASLATVVSGIIELIASKSWRSRLGLILCITIAIICLYFFGKHYLP